MRLGKVKWFDAGTQKPPISGWYLVYIRQFDAVRAAYWFIGMWLETKMEVSHWAMMPEGPGRQRTEDRGQKKHPPA